MRTLGAWIVAGASVLALAVLNIACSPYTQGLGGELAADSDESGDFGATPPDLEDAGGDEHGDSNNDTSANDTDTLARECSDFAPEQVAAIELDNLELGPDDCSEPVFRARIATSHPGFYGMYACDCDDDPACSGEAYELTVLIADPDWRPKLEVDDCYFFHVYSEEVSPGVCRRNRVDISKTKQGAPWYSAGMASEDLDRFGLAITPVRSIDCTDSCGEWQHRDVIVATDDDQVRLGWGEVGSIGGYEFKHWQSYVTPSGCEAPAADVTIWTAR